MALAAATDVTGKRTFQAQRRLIREALAREGIAVAIESGVDVNLSQDDPVLEEATRRLVKEFSPSKVYLFGSRSRGDATPDSDYDFLVITAGEPVRSLDDRPRSVLEVVHPDKQGPHVQ